MPAAELETILPAGWPRPRGYANAIRVPADRDLLVLAGQVGWDERERLVGPGFVEQFAQALRNCRRLVECAGGGPEDIVRMTVFVAELTPYREALEEVGRAWREVMGRHYPCMSLVQVRALLEPGALVEIEATAALSRRAEGAAGRGTS